MGAGKETAGATTPSDLNNFQFQEGKRELEKYRRRDLAEAREEAPKGSRVCGGASLDAAKKAGEREPGRGEPRRHCERGGSPPKGGSRGERWARSGCECGGGRSSGRETTPPLVPPSPPPGPDCRVGRVSAARGRARSAPPCGRASRLPAPARNPGRTAARSSHSGADRWRVSGCGLLPRLLEPLLGCFSPFLSFFSIKVAAVGRAQGGWSGGISVDTRGQPDRPLPARRGSVSEACALTHRLEVQLCCDFLPKGVSAGALEDSSSPRAVPSAVSSPSLCAALSLSQSSPEDLVCNLVSHLGDWE